MRVLSERAARAPAAHPDAELDELEVASLHAKLLEERARLRAIADAQRASILGAELGAPDETDAADAELALATGLDARAHVMADLGAIEHALAKLARGQYGLCEETDEPIGYARLRAQPWARYAITVQESVERSERARRPRR